MFPPASTEGPGELSLADSTHNPSPVHGPSQSQHVPSAQGGLKQYLNLVLRREFLFREEPANLLPPGRTDRGGLKLSSR